MSLILPVECSEGVAVAADRQLTVTEEGMNYPVDQKTKLFRKGSAIVGVAGSKFHQLAQLVEESDIDNQLLASAANLGPDCQYFAQKLRVQAEKIYGPTATVPGAGNFFGKDDAILLVTHTTNQAGIYRLIPTDVWSFVACGQTPIETQAIGQRLHGALYYVARFGQGLKTLDQGAYLAYFCVNEVAVLDGAVGGPVDVWTVSNGMVKPRTPTEMRKLKRKYEKAVSEMQQWFSGMPRE